MKIAIFGDEFRSAAGDELIKFFEALIAGDRFEVMMPASYMGYLKAFGCDMRSVSPLDPKEFTADMVLSVGGDGTFLHTASLVGARQIPIMGINSGRLGYLSAIDISDWPEVIDTILEKRFAVSDRTMLQVSCAGMPTAYSLNEVALLKKDTASMISVKAEPDSHYLATYMGDGLIVSTPTGSTAYNLSVGGPIVAPSAPVWVISPVAPHSLSMRPLVVADTTVLHLTAESRVGSFLLSVDGRSTALECGVIVTLSKAPFVTKIVNCHKRGFADTLRSKLLWGADAR